ncbi:MAG: hypothetical protein HOW97_31075, partial [Catenulispora sp.]|nr:hypothetical protein [Catenulispora sp.]
TCEQVVAPADADAGREAERAAGQRLQAAGHSARATALIVHGAGETAVLVALSETVSEELRAGITAAVRLALRGRKGFSESPRILLIDPGDTGPCEPR